MTNSSHRLALRKKLFHNGNGLRIHAHIFWSAASRNHQTHKISCLYAFQRCVNRNTVTGQLHVCIQPDEIMYNQLQRFADFFIRSNNNHFVPQHLQCLLRNLYFVIFRTISRQKQNLFHSPCPPSGYTLRIRQFFLSFHLIRSWAVISCSIAK